MLRGKQVPRERTSGAGDCLARIFLSHSSANNGAALVIHNWLIAEGWDDVFLDLDPTRGIAAGERWERRLYEAANRCEAVVFLVSRAWLASEWCLKELHLAQKLNKRIFGVLVEDIPIGDLPADLTGTWQVVNLAAGGDHRMFRATLPDGTEVHLTFSQAGLSRLKAGLTRAGLDARFFAWPPSDDPERPPYRGLKALEVEDAGIFFGREAQTIEALDRLRGLGEAAPPRIMVILGASGAGKSSFLRAGLLPRLERDDRNFLPLPIVRPERAALSGENGLLRSLEAAATAGGLKRSRAQIKAAVDGGAAAIWELLDDLAHAVTPGADPDGGAAAPAPRIVLPIDQGEELFQSEGAAEAEVLLNLVRDLSIDGKSNLVVLFTIRSDAFERLQTAPAFDGVALQTFNLPPMPRGAYQTVIEGPARRLAETNRPLAIEPALTEALLADIEAGGGKDALPLLAFTLERLYLEHGGDGDLKLSEYRSLGGIQGSIEAAVERALASADSDPAVPRDRNARLVLLRRALIPWLAGIDPETREPRRRVARLSEIPEEARPLLNHLIAARLLSTDVSPLTKEQTIEPAHEALLRRWGLLQGWLDEDFAALATLEAIRRAARDWAANDRDADWLAHSAGRLEDAEAIARRADLAGMLEPTDRAYLAAARMADTERRDRELNEAKQLAEAQREAAERQRQVAARTRLGLIAASVLAIIAIGTAVFGFQKAREADEASELANQRAQETLEALKLAKQNETEALEQTQLAIKQTKLALEAQQEAKRNAAKLSVSVANQLTEQGATRQAAALLLEGAKSFDEDTVPDEMLIAFHRLNEAMAARQIYDLPAGAVPFEGFDALYFFDQSSGDILRFDGSGPPAVVFDGDPKDSPVVRLNTSEDGKTLFIVRENRDVERISGGKAAKAGALKTIEAKEGRTVDQEKIDIAPDGVVFSDIGYRDAGSDSADFVQLVDGKTGEAAAGTVDLYRPAYFSGADGSRYIMDWAPSEAQPYRVTMKDRVAAIERATLSEDEEAHLRFRRCFLAGYSAVPEFTDKVEFSGVGYGDRCITKGKVIIHSYSEFGSAGENRSDEVIDPGEDKNTDIRGLIRRNTNYKAPDQNFSWLGADADLDAYALIVNRDLVVFNEYGVVLLQRNTTVPGPARFVGASKLAVAEPAAGRISVYDLAYEPPRREITHDGADKLIAHETKLAPLNKGTCVGYALGSMGEAIEYNATLPDGAKLTLAGSTLSSGEGPAQITISAGGKDQKIDLGAAASRGDSCVQFSTDWKQLLLWQRDARLVTLYDFDKARQTGNLDAARIDDVPVKFASSAFPVGATGDVITASWGEPVRRWHWDGARRQWSSQEIYSGDDPVFYAEPDATGRRLLLLESTGGGGVQGVLYSVPGRQRWIELGDDYKWFGEAFSEDGGVAAGAREVQTYIRLPTLTELVKETEGRIGDVCRPSTGTDYHLSPCWPDWLR